MLQGEVGCVRLCLLPGLLDQFITAALTAPRLEPAGKRAISPGRENSHLALAAGLGVHLAHGRLVRGQLLLDPGSHVSRCSGQVVLGIIQFILIKVQLRLGDFQVIPAARIRGAAGGGCQTPHPRLILLGHLLQLRYLLRKFEGFARRRRRWALGLP